jgi:hypothetical protein
MVRASAVSRFVISGFLAAATAAHAECGWVLWNDEVRLDYAERTEVRLWHTIAGAPTKRECDARLREEIERVMRADTRPRNVQFKAQGDAVQLTYLGAGQPDGKATRVQTFRYVCLPAGVDPREAGAR